MEWYEQLSKVESLHGLSTIWPHLRRISSEVVFCDPFLRYGTWSCPVELMIIHFFEADVQDGVLGFNGAGFP